MTRKYLHAEKAGPLWAVFGAPLVGVPLMVAVLALGSGTAVDATVDVDAGFAVEHVEIDETAPEPDTDRLRSD